MLITKKETKEAAREFSIDYKPFEDDCAPKKYAEFGFLKGVEFAEKKLEGLAIEFIEWAGDNNVSITHKDKRGDFQQVWYQGANISAKKLFQKFIKTKR